MDPRIEEIKNIFEEVVDTLDSCKHIPFTDKAVVPKDKLMVVLEKLRKTIPEEIARADRILKTSESIVKTANQEATEIVDLAKEQAEKIKEAAKVEREIFLNNSDITKNAETEAEAFREHAEEMAKQLRIEADRYSENAKQWSLETAYRTTDYLVQLFESALKDVKEKRIALQDKIKTAEEERDEK